jgi:hypothetical protein
MLKYLKDYPDLPLEIVETISGTKEYRVNCRRLLGKYYIIDVDIILYNKKWYILAENKHFVFDNEKQVWENSKMIRLHAGIVGFNKDGSYKNGFYSPNALKNCTVIDRIGTMQENHLNCMDYKLLDPALYVEHIERGMYVSLKDITKERASVIRNNQNNGGNNYSIDDSPLIFSMLKDNYRKSKLPVSVDDYKIGKFLQNYTYGVEIEASVGNVIPHVLNKYGVYICRDGSLRHDDGTVGPEFVTVPFNGPKGVSLIKGFCKELQHRSKIDPNCSLHLHVGGTRTDREFIVAVYKLCFKLQNEIFTMFPFYKTNERKYAGKEKNYAQKLIPILTNYSTVPKTASFSRKVYTDYVNDNYRIIFKFLLEGTPPSITNNRVNKFHTRERKWERHSRYFWINFMNMFFSNRNTLEFRLHTPTTNSQKILSWQMICTAIINYAEKNSFSLVRDDISKINLNDIINFSYSSDPETCDYLKEYIMFRKKTFLKDKLKEDYMSMEYIAQDKSFVFPYKDFEKKLFA